MKHKIATAFVLCVGVSFSAIVSAASANGEMEAGNDAASTSSGYGSSNSPGSLTSNASGMGTCVPPSRTSFLAGGSDNTPALGAYLLPELGLKEFYTDNIYLAPPGGEKSNSATIVSPGIRGCTVGSVLQANFDYMGEGVKYAQNPPANSFFNHVNGDFHALVFPGHLFLDGNTSYGQTAINPFEAYSSNNAYAVGNNRTNIWTSSLTPYWVQSFGPLGLGTLRYTYGRVEYNNSSIYNSTSYGESFILNNPSQNTDWTWTLNWSTNTVRYGRLDRNVYFDNAYITLGYQLTRHFRLLGTEGVEDNYLANGDIQRYGSRYWNAGFAWQDLRFSLEALWGRRFFGNSLSVSANYHTPSVSVGVQYTEMPVVEATQASTFYAGNIAQTSTYNITAPLNQSQYVNAYLNKRLQGNFTYRFSASSLSLTAYDEQNDYFINQLGSYRLRGGTVTWNWPISERSQLATSFQRRSIIQDNLAPYFTNYGSVIWTYLVTPVTHLSFTLARQSAQSVNIFQRYAADSATLQLNTVF